MKSKLSLEVVFLLITVLLIVAFIFPIFDYYGPPFQFYFSNILFIFVFLTYTRYIFLLPYTPFSHTKRLKLVFIFLSIPLIMYGLDRLLEFQAYLDEVGFVDISGDDINQASKYATYARTQYLFFCSAALVVMIILPLRMVVSIWRIVNKKGKV